VKRYHVPLNLEKQLDPALEEPAIQAPIPTETPKSALQETPVTISGDDIRNDVTREHSTCIRKMPGKYTDFELYK